MSSDVNIIARSTNSCGETNTKCKSYLSSDNDLESDAPMLEHKVNVVHQELSLAGGLPSSGPGKGK